MDCTDFKSLSLKGEDHPRWKDGRVTLKNGYILVKDDSHPRGKNNYGYVLEHILVVEERLSRYLFPNENIHHKNGVRGDNRLSNLDLWAKRQPAGQRVEDMRFYAQELLALYPEQAISLRDLPVVVPVLFPLVQLNSWDASRATLNHNGYRVVKYPGHPRAKREDSFRIFEHILTMENMLGRYLNPGENVHHKNGIKDDNRAENLELWVTTQPSGQRVEDLIRWANEFLFTYQLDMA